MRLSQSQPGWSAGPAVSGAVLCPGRKTKTRTIGLELDTEQKEADSSWVGRRQKKGPEVSLWSHSAPGVLM